VRARVAIAEPAAQAANVALQVEDDLCEFDFGPLEGRSYTELVCAGMPFPWGPNSENWPPEGGGETLEHFYERLGSVANRVAEYDGHTAIVAHGGVIRGLLAIWLGLSTESLNRLTVANVHGFILNMSKRTPELEQFGLEPEDFGHYA
jgi:broad specificity phosphatase PhoE